jgi:site-specific recombinase XerD
MAAAALIPAPRTAGLTLHFEIVQRVETYVRQSRAKSTLRGYRADWRDFSAWCQDHMAQTLPAAPETVCGYLAAVADRGLKVGSIQRRLSAIAAAHVTADLDSPTTKASVKLTMAGIRRSLGVAQEGKAALLTSDIAALLAHLPKGLLGIRDRAVLLVGYAGAFRRSELVALDVRDLDFSTEGLKVVIRRSKTDQEGEGQRIGIAHGTSLCPVKALEAWISAAGITEGAVFRSMDRHGNVRGRLRDRAVALVVKRYARAAGMDERKYAGHSLRAGLVTQAAINQVPELTIMKTTRHKSADMLRRYVRETSLFRDNASARVGL